MVSENKIRILFIVNPVSGFRSGKSLPRKIKTIPDYRKIVYDIAFTSYPGHGKEIAENALEKGIYSHIVAVGGDGTVNEVASALVGSSVAFGILATGSGNGLARHMGFPLGIKKGLRQILEGRCEKIDVMEINGRYSFNVSGLGFDAEVAYEFGRKKIRGLFVYLLTVLRLWFTYGNKDYRLCVDGKDMEIKAFLLSFANSSQYGNNAYIAPAASVRDGLMDVCYIERPEFYRIPYYVYCLMRSELGRIPKFKELKAREVCVNGHSPHMHVDGDYAEAVYPLKAKIIPAALNMVIPRISGRL